MAWAMYCEGIVNCLHYLDDFLFWGPPSSQECGRAMRRATAWCERLGLPVAPHKTVGPTTTLTFLGIEIDSEAWLLRLPADKLDRLRQTLARWRSKRHATKHELQVLIGLLNHAAAVVRPGRTFIRHIIDTSKIPRRQSQKVRLNVSCRANMPGGLHSPRNGMEWHSSRICRLVQQLCQMPQALGAAVRTTQQLVSSSSCSGLHHGQELILLRRSSSR